jgi:transposase
VRDKSVLRKLLGLCVFTVVIVRQELHEGVEGGRSKLVVWVRHRARVRGRCGRCAVVAPWFDNGGGERSWRHIEMGMGTCELVADAPRVSCPVHGVVVAQVSFARHDSAFTRAFEDLVVFDAIVSSKLAVARRYGVSWRAVNNMCVRVATEALGRVDLLEGLVAIAIDEVKYKKGQFSGVSDPCGSVAGRGLLRGWCHTLWIPCATCRTVSHIGKFRAGLACRADRHAGLLDGGRRRLAASPVR